MAITPYTWTNGGGTNAWATATNWSPASEPAGTTASPNMDTLYFNDQSLGQLTTFTGLASTEEYNVIVEPGFNYYIGASGSAMTWDDCDTLFFAGSGIVSSYLAINTLTTGILDSRSTKDDVLVYSGTGASPTIGRFNVKNGKMTFASGTDLTGAVITVGSASTAQTTAELTIAASLTTSAATTLFVFGGKVTTSTTIPIIIMSGGQLILSGSAGATSIYMAGGEVIWDAASTITTCEVNGGVIRTRTARQSRILTNLNVYPGGMADFTIGGHLLNLTGTPVWRDYAGGAIKAQRGAKVSFATA